MNANRFREILYEKKNKVATITINRPERYNACLPTTVDELAQAFIDAWADKRVYVVVFTSAGDKAFCTGGDQSEGRVAVIMSIFESTLGGLRVYLLRLGGSL